MDAYHLLKNIESQCFDSSKPLSDDKSEAKDWLGIGAHLGEEFIVVDIKQIYAVINRPEIASCPSDKSWFLGVISWGGKLLPVIDLQDCVLDSPSKDLSQSKVIVIKQNGYLSGLLIKRILGLKRFNSNEIENVELSSTSIDSNFIDGSFFEDLWPWNIFNCNKFIEFNQFYSIVS